MFVYVKIAPQKCSAEAGVEVEVRSVQVDRVYVHRVKLKKMNDKKQRGKGALYTF